MPQYAYRAKRPNSQDLGEDYWVENYSDPLFMDGIGNAPQHARYLYNMMAVEYIDISSIVDLGMGLGFLFEEMLKLFKPYRAVGIEPSEYAFKKLANGKIDCAESTKLYLYQMDLSEWCQSSLKRFQRFDLGLCTSVFQYLSDDEITAVLPVMASRIRYLYFSVPTDKELKRQRDEASFHDRYAISRSRRKYLQFLSPHFTVVGARVLESKSFFNEEDTDFTDLLYRF